MILIAPPRRSTVTERRSSGRRRADASTSTPSGSALAAASSWRVRKGSGAHSADKSLAIRRNRRVAWRGVKPPKGQSCDEYPFASTYQGAAFVGHGHFKPKALSSPQNSGVGTILGIFFLHERIADGVPVIALRRTSRPAALRSPHRTGRTLASALRCQGTAAPPGRRRRPARHTDGASASPPRSPRRADQSARTGPGPASRS